jgi:DNA-binding transcriptional LysR family regulator
VGLALAREDVVRPYIERGELVPVLEEFSSRSRVYLYYPARRQASPPLRAPIGYLLRGREGQRQEG